MRFLLKIGIYHWKLYISRNKLLHLFRFFLSMFSRVPITIKLYAREKNYADRCFYDNHFDDDNNNDKQLLLYFMFKFCVIFSFFFFHSFMFSVSLYQLITYTIRRCSQTNDGLLTSFAPQYVNTVNGAKKKKHSTRNEHTFVHECMRRTYAII